jgi:15-cis-phytoene synthase
MQSEQVKSAYDYCRKITQRASKTFYWGSVFLPSPKRRAVWAVYALCRVVDDIVDESRVPAIARPGHLVGSISPENALAYWRESLQRIYAGQGLDEHPIQMAWSDMLERFPVPVEPVLDLLKGVEMDLAVNRYETFDDLYLYCYRVAGTVGLLTSPIFGYSNEAALSHAVNLGVALQLTNILRDVGEDAMLDRIYIPQDEMRRFGYSEEELKAGVINKAFCELMRFQMERAEDYYQRSQSGISMLSADCRLAVRLSGTLYRRILDRIQSNNYNVFTKRAHVPLKTKLAAASQYWFMSFFDARIESADGV